MGNDFNLGEPDFLDDDVIYNCPPNSTTPCLMIVGQEAIDRYRALEAATPATLPSFYKEGDAAAATSAGDSEIAELGAALKAVGQAEKDWLPAEPKKWDAADTHARIVAYKAAPVLLARLRDSRQANGLDAILIDSLKTQLRQCEVALEKAYEAATPAPVLSLVEEASHVARWAPEAEERERPGIRVRRALYPNADYQSGWATQRVVWNGKIWAHADFVQTVQVDVRFVLVEADVPPFPTPPTTPSKEADAEQVMQEVGQADMPDFVAPGFEMSDHAAQHWFGKDMADEMKKGATHD